MAHLLARPARLSRPAPAGEARESGGDIARAAALVDVAEREAPGLGVRAIVADDLELRVAAVGRAHRPHAGPGAQQVREVAVAVPAGEGRVAGIGAPLGRLVAALGHRFHVGELDLAE